MKTGRLLWIGYFLLLSAGILFLHYKLIHRVTDDAYIHFRIARNFLQFGQPYFNLNEPVMGTSSPAWTLLLPLLFKIFGESLQAISILNALFICAGTVIFSWFFSYAAQRFRYLLLMLYSILYPSLLLFPSSGLMEISFCMFVVGLGLFLLTGNNALGFSFLSMAVFIRYEMVVLLGIIGFVLLLNRNSSRFIKVSIKRFLLFCFFGALPFLVFQLVYFGTVIPQTITARGQVYDLTFQYVLDTLVSGLMPVGLQMKLLHWKLCLVVMAILALLSLRGQKSGWLKLYDLRVLFAISGVIVFLLYLLKRVFVFEWYIPLYSVPILLGFIWWFLSHPIRWFRYTGGFVAAALLAIGCLKVVRIFNTPADQISNFTHARVKVYLKIGKELAASYPNKTLLTPEIGALGWTFEGKIIDAVGLVSPEALKYHPMAVPQERTHGAIGAIPPGLVRDYKPDLIVAYGVFIQAFRKSSEIHHYTEIIRPAFLPEDMRRYPDGLWGSNSLYLFIRTPGK